MKFYNLVLSSIFSLVVFLPTCSFGKDCKPLSYFSEDFEYLEDFNGDMDKTCTAAEKSATWKACVAALAMINEISNVILYKPKAYLTKIKLFAQRTPRQ